MSTENNPATGTSAPDVEATEIQSWYLYLVETASGSLYCGITLDVKRRFREHSSSTARSARALRGKGPLKLRFVAEAGKHGDALRAEIKVKKLSRQAKVRLIEGDHTLLQTLGLRATESVKEDSFVTRLS